MKRLYTTLIITGIIIILGSIIATPDNSAALLSSDGIISSEGFERIQVLRRVSFLIGSILICVGIIFLKFPERASDYIKKPEGTMLILIFCWVILAYINFMLKTAGLSIGTPDLFPFSEFYGPRVYVSGLPYTVLFLIVFFLSLKYSNHFGLLTVWGAGLILIILGNLAQGGVNEAFYKPISAPYYYEGVAYYQQYYHEAIQITEWREWLDSFNMNQLSLLQHTQTHPPYAILLHYFILKLSHGNMAFLAGTFILLSSVSIIVIFKMMRVFGLSVPQSSRFALLFSVVPAYNIYSAVSLDGVIASFGAFFLLGTVMIVKRGIHLSGILLFTAGMLLTNLITFTGLFLVASAGLIALKELTVSKKSDIVMSLLIASGVMLFTHLCMRYFYGYDHVQAFMTAFFHEPKSLGKPLAYIMTRLENLTMLAIFLSFGVSSVFVRPSFLKPRFFDWRDSTNFIFIAGLLPLLIFLLIGGFHTGEPARICLFLYPFFVLILRNVREPMLNFFILSAGVQTIIMQTFGGYFW